MSEDITSALLFANRPVIPPVDVQQPPPHVVDYWFDRLGLSLDPTSSDNHLNATGSPFQFPLLDDVLILYRVSFFRLVYALRGF